MRGETACNVAILSCVRFQSTPLMRGETIAVLIKYEPATNFNPLPSREGRRPGMSYSLVYAFISIHSPHARGDVERAEKPHAFHISIHSPHARGDLRRSKIRPTSPISIHSPHARGDVRCAPGWCTGYSISIHSPHARGDLSDDAHKEEVSNFNPLPSCEGRPLTARPSSGIRHFNPLPSCEGRPRAPPLLGAACGFQSTPLMRGETA